MKFVTCPRCGGAHYDPEEVNTVPCGSCGGQGVYGYVTREMSIDGYGDDRAEGMPDECSSCRGCGYQMEPKACTKCGGLGEIEVEAAPSSGASDD